MANLSSFFPAAGGSIGGAVPKTEIFTSSGVWNVPQSVQDAINSEGYAEVGILLVGGGHSSNSGEVISDLFRMTTADYDDPNDWDDPNQPEVSIAVGAAGGNTGITTVPGSPTADLVFTRRVADNSSYNNTLVVAPSQNPPLVHSVRVQFIAQTPYSSGFSQTSTGATTVPTAPAGTSYDLTWEWDGGVAFSPIGFITYNAGGPYYDFDLTYNTSNNTFTSTWNGSFNSVDITTSIRYSINGVLHRTTARSGGSSDYSKFRNNPQSTEGYFGGFSRLNGETEGSGGANPQGGYVQIFYS